VTFQYGTSTRYGTTEAVQGVGGVVAVPVLLAVTGLKRDTTYHYRVTVTTPDGTSFGADRAFTTSVGPTIGRLTIAPRSFRPTRVAKITYTDSASATTTFTVMRCVKVRRGKCTRYTGVRRFMHHDVTGRNQVGLNPARLGPGSYLLEASARAKGKTGPTASVTFRVT
jgi:hypothetical protein